MFEGEMFHLDAYSTDISTQYMHTHVHVYVHGFGFLQMV